MCLNVVYYLIDRIIIIINIGGNTMFRTTEQELKAYAEKKAESIVIRSYDEKGNSSDTIYNPIREYPEM